jgi:hypothetical protein
MNKNKNEENSPRITRMDADEEKNSDENGFCKIKESPHA